MEKVGFLRKKVGFLRKIDNRDNVFADAQGYLFYKDNGKMIYANEQDASLGLEGQEIIFRTCTNCLNFADLRCGGVCGFVDGLID
jgi:hypothetical protein